MSISNWRDINLDDITIKNSYMTSKKKIILSPIEYNNKYLFIQTPKATILTPPPKFSYGNVYYKMGLCFSYYEFNKKTNLFITKIRDIENTLFKRLKQRIGSPNLELISSIKKSKIKDDVFFNVNVQLHNNKTMLPVFDFNKNSRDTDYIIPYSTSFNILYLKDIWNKKNILGFNWIILQTKVFLPFLYLTECLIQDDTPNCDFKGVMINKEQKILSTININKKINPVFEKYVKMKKVGVPDIAIKIDLKKNNLAYEDYVKYLNGESSIEHIPKLPPKISANMLQGIKLKKFKKSKKKSKMKPKPSPVKTTGYRPPGPDQLMTMLQKLKKTNKTIF